MDLNRGEIKRRHKRRKIPCSLTQKAIYHIFSLNDGFCDYTGFKFSDLPEDPLYPSLERIDDNKGYELGNVCLVTRCANTLKDEFFDKMRRSEQNLKDFEKPLLEKLKQNLTPQYLQSLKDKYNINIENKEEIKMTEVAKKLVKRPDDLAATGYYTKFCKALLGKDKDVEITFSQFKSKYLSKRCKLTGDILDSSDKFMLVLDKDSVVNKDNVIVTSEKLGLALTKIQEETGISLKKLLKIN